MKSDSFCVSEVGQIKSLLLKHPEQAFLGVEEIRSQWKELNYTAPPDFEEACREYDFFLDILKKL